MNIHDIILVLWDKNLKRLTFWTEIGQRESTGHSRKPTIYENVNEHRTYSTVLPSKPPVGLGLASAMNASDTKLSSTVTIPVT